MWDYIGQDFKSCASTCSATSASPAHVMGRPGRQGNAQTQRMWRTTRPVGAFLTQVFHQSAGNLPLLRAAAQTSARAAKKRWLSTLTPFGR